MRINKLLAAASLVTFCFAAGAAQAETLQMWGAQRHRCLVHQAGRGL